uniref:Uncharacterized protein n=1 Tax=Podarcis muralis TaxID=64176 RepID=A0A670IAI3_PODMU
MNFFWANRREKLKNKWDCAFLFNVDPRSTSASCCCCSASSSQLQGSCCSCPSLSCQHPQELIWLSVPVNYVYRVLQLQKELDSVMSNGWKLEQLLASDLPVSVGVKPRLNFCVSPLRRDTILKVRGSKV